MMNTVIDSSKKISKERSVLSLAEKYEYVCQRKEHWTIIWKMFFEDLWFTHCLNASAKILVHRCNMPIHNVEDVKQEAMIQFAYSIKRNPSLGFLPSRGSFEAFLATVIYRCCQKGLRQFRHSDFIPMNENFQHPTIDRRDELDEQLDLRDVIERISEPYRTTFQYLCDGKSIKQIAKLQNISARTVYRWLDLGIEKIKLYEFQL